MAIIVGGKTTGTGAEVETNTLALRASQRPIGLNQQIPYTGSYTLGIDNGAVEMTAGAQTDAEIFQWRWTDERVACLVRSIRLSCGTKIAFAGGRLKFDLFFATKWTGIGSGGSTPILTGRNSSKRTAFPTTAAPSSSIMIANTAPLTAGTKTLDASPLASWSMGATATIGPVDTNRGMISLWQRDTADEYPLVLGFNEGFVIRVTCPATGTWYFGVNVEWCEMEARSYFG